MKLKNYNKEIRSRSKCAYFTNGSKLYKYMSDVAVRSWT